MRRLRNYLKQVKLNRFLLSQTDHLNDQRTTLYTIHCSGLTSREWRHFKQTTHSLTLYQPIDAGVPGPLCYISTSRLPQAGPVALISSPPIAPRRFNNLASLSSSSRASTLLLFSGNFNHVDISISLNLNREDEGSKLISYLNPSIDYLLCQASMGLIYTLELLKAGESRSHDGKAKKQIT